MKETWLGCLYLEDLDEMIHSLHGHLKHSTRAKDNLLFCSQVAGDQQSIRDLCLGKAGWLRQLTAMKKLHQGNLPLLGHLSAVAAAETNTVSQRDFAKLILRKMITWSYKVTVAGGIDILELAWQTRLKLECNLNVYVLCGKTSIN